MSLPVNKRRNAPNAYVIDVYNGGMSGENRLCAEQKTALIGATLLIEFTYYLPQPDPKRNNNNDSPLTIN
jgi:hypothetical protein